jgi:transcriptional regulator with XRE-family HTH domain
VQASPRDWLIALGRALREARLECGHSQMSLGREADISTNYVGGIERGQRSPTVEKIAVLAAALDLALDDLFCRAAELLPSTPAAAV